MQINDDLTKTIKECQDDAEKFKTAENYRCFNKYLLSGNDAEQEAVLKFFCTMAENENTPIEDINTLAYFCCKYAEQLSCNDAECYLNPRTELLADLMMSVEYDQRVWKEDILKYTEKARSYYERIIYKDHEDHEDQLLNKLAQKYLFDTDKFYKGSFFAQDIFELKADFTKDNKEQKKLLEIGKKGIFPQESVAHLCAQLFQSNPEDKQIKNDILERLKKNYNEKYPSLPDPSILNLFSKDTEIKEEIKRQILDFLKIKYDVWTYEQNNPNTYMNKYSDREEYLAKERLSIPIIKLAAQDKDIRGEMWNFFQKFGSRDQFRTFVGTCLEDKEILPEIAAYCLKENLTDILLGFKPTTLEALSQLQVTPKTDISTIKHYTDFYKLALREHPQDVQIAQKVLSLTDKFPRTNIEAVEEVSDIYVLIQDKQTEDVSDRKEKLAQNLEEDFHNLLKRGKIKEAIDRLIAKEHLNYSKHANKYNLEVLGDCLSCVTKRMKNGCMAVGFLCEDRHWNGDTRSGIDWRWYARGMIIDIDRAKVVSECQTQTITVRAPYNSRRDIYKNVDQKNFMKIDNDRLTVCVGPYDSASTQYSPQIEAKKEKGLAKIKKRTADLEEKTNAKIAQKPTSTEHTSNSLGLSKSSSRDTR